MLPGNEILTDIKNKAFMSPVKNNLKNNLVEINDNCLENIAKFKTAYCNMQISEKEEIKEISEGIVITKNLEKTKIAHTCNTLELNVKGNKLIKFQNCTVKIKQNIFNNMQAVVYDKPIIPNFITEIVENFTLPVIKLEELHFDNIKNRKIINEILLENQNKHILNLSLNITIIISIIVIIGLIVIVCNKKKNKKLNQVNIEISSSEPQTKAGGVMATGNVI